MDEEPEALQEPSRPSGLRLGWPRLPGWPWLDYYCATYWDMFASVLISQEPSLMWGSISPHIKSVPSHVLYSWPILRNSALSTSSHEYVSNIVFNQALLGPPILLRPPVLSSPPKPSVTKDGQQLITLSICSFVPLVSVSKNPSIRLFLTSSVASNALGILRFFIWVLSRMKTIISPLVKHFLLLTSVTYCPSPTSLSLKKTLTVNQKMWNYN